MERLRAALARVIRPEAIAGWLDEPDRAFGGLKPVEVIERGRIDRIREDRDRVDRCQFSARLDYARHAFSLVEVRRWRTSTVDADSWRRG